MRSVSYRFYVALVVVMIGAFLVGYLVQTSASSGSASNATAAVPTLRATTGQLPATAVAVSTVVAAPTSVVATTVVPTAQPSNGGTGNQPVPTVPTIDFQPRGGVAGTTVAVRGWGFSANSRVAVRIGLPSAVGEVLASAQPNAAGVWNAQFVVPGTLPSGDKITTPNMRIVAMNEQNQSLASAAFAFEPGNPPTDDGSESKPVYGYANTSEEAVRYLLDSLRTYPNGPQAFAYVSKDLYERYKGGAAYNLLQLQNPFQSYTLDGVVGMDGHWIVQQVTLDGITRLHFVTNTVDESGPPWVVSEIRNLPIDVPPSGNHSPEQVAAAEQVVRAYYKAMGEDRAAEAWALQTESMQAFISQESIATSGSYLVSSEVTEALVTASTNDSITIRATLNMVLEPTAPGSLGGGLRNFSATLVSTPEGGWLINEVTPL